MPGKTYNGQTWVPIDDVTTWVFCYSWNPDRPLRDVERGYVEGVPSIYSEVDEHFFPVRNRANDYGLDRKVQKSESFTGIDGINVQDRAIQESMGAVVDRSLEHLGPADRAIIQARRLLLQAVRAVQAGDTPDGVAPTYADAHAHEAVLPRDTDWRAMIARGEMPTTAVIAPRA